MITRQTEELIGTFVERSKEILKGDLTGIYLHGSAAMGCFHPAVSDLDLITVVGAPLTGPVKRAYLDMAVECSASGPAKGIEMSVVLRDVCDPFVYPTPVELHFSEAHLKRCLDDPDGYIREMQKTDRDLAAHFTVISKRGRCLCGATIESVFAQVPARDYMDSIWRDVAGAEEEIAGNTVYLTLNLARVLAYKETGAVLSKKEGGEWAIGNVPAGYRPLIADALRAYAGGAPAAFDEALAGRYAGYMIARIRA